MSDFDELNKMFQAPSPYLKGIATQETKYWFIPGHHRNVNE